jgi:hypothetical protein
VLFFNGIKIGPPRTHTGTHILFSNKLQYAPL